MGTDPNPKIAVAYIKLTTNHLIFSPFGENPLFKPVAETGKAAELLKPGGLPAPAAQKLLAAGQYKVSPHRNIKVNILLRRLGQVIWLMYVNNRQ